MRPPDHRHRLAILVLGLLLLWTLYEFVGQLVVLYGTFYSVDMPLFILVAQDYLSQGLLYQRADDLAMLYQPGVGVYKYPPFFQLSIVPWFAQGGTDVGYYHLVRTVMLLMYLVSALVVIHSLVRLLLRDDPVRHVYCLLAVIATLWFNPFHACYGITTEIPILFCITLCIASWASRPAIAGTLLGVATMLKVYPAILLGQAVFSLRGRAGFGYLTGLLLTLLVSIAYFGMGENRFYFLEVLPVLLREGVSPGPGNLNIESVIAGYLPASPTGNTFLIQRIIVIIGLCALTSIYRNSTPEKMFALSSLWICGLLLTLANYWYQYQLLLLIPLLTLLAWAISARSKALCAITLIAAMPLYIDEIWLESLLQAAIHKNNLTIEVLQHRLKTESSFDIMLDISPLYTFLKLIISLRALLPHLLFIMMAWLIVYSSRHSSKPYQTV